MEIRRLSFVAGAEAPAVEDEPSEKRQRMDGGSSSGSAEESGTTPGGSSSLEPPVMASAELETSGRRPRFGMAAVCGRRRDMEDAVSIRPDFVRRDDRVSARHHFFGVFDVADLFFRALQVASLCSDRMHEVVAEEVETLASGAAASPQAWRWRWRGASLGWTRRRWTGAVSARARTADASASRRGVTTWALPPWSPSSAPPGSSSPTAATPAPSSAATAPPSPSLPTTRYRRERDLFFLLPPLNQPAGSDRSNGSDDVQILQPDREDELQRIEAAGGRVIYWDGARVLGVLAMSRAIGDSYLKPYVIPEPEVRVLDREEGDECLILASDGLWDVVSNETACDIARMCLQGGGGGDEEEEVAGEGDGGGGDATCSDAAVLLTKLALARHSADNVSVVVVDLRKKWKRAPTTPTMTNS
ncbi:phosphatase 2C [Musa troglodytarum]|uniref:protein-serine/threonine phosphatase n=1 Tax=Musa troglodytarum TaxID=320322 RepID=A0A9E7EMY4_9LILI|nr:phosphatase 2C [Musa troglodytarum]